MGTQQQTDGQRMHAETMRLVRLAVLGSISILPLLILPSMVGALVDGAGLSESQAGWVAAVGSFGGALAAIAIALRIRHLDPRRLAVIGLVGLAVFDGASALVHSLPVGVFLALRALSGVCGAAAYAAVMSTYASLPNSERGYGMFTVFQFGLSGLGLYVLPLALPSIGVAGLYLGLSLAALLGLTQTAPVIRREVAVEEPALELHLLVRPAAVLAMVGIGLFETANNMHFTYAERIGVNFGLPDLEIGTILAVASFLGIPAAFAVVWLGDRFGELRPILVALTVAVIGLLLLLNGTGDAVYGISMCLLGMAWAFGLPYFQAFEARLDPGGSVVVAGGFFTSVGAALGPALAATLVRPGDYSWVIVTSIGIYLAVAVLMHAAARR